MPVGLHYMRTDELLSDFCRDIQLSLIAGEVIRVNDPSDITPIRMSEPRARAKCVNCGASKWAEQLCDYCEKYVA